MFGRYQLLAKLGRGGMAEVFLAVAAGPSGFRKLVVIKRLHEHLEDEPEIIEMFLDEARIAARLNHPNLIQTYEVGRVESRHFIAMEYLEGVSLDRLLARVQELGRPVAAAVAARILIDVLDGLAHAHDLRDFDGSPLHVVHRDVSPHNVFVAWDGTVKVIDFGIAKADNSSVHSSPGTIKGKSSYIAPEQAMSKDVDARADLWSAGVILWEALAGKRLFKSINDVATLREALSARIPPVREIVPETPPELDAIVALALQREVEARYRSAADMKDDLEGFLRGEGATVGREEIASLLEQLLGEERERQRALLAICVGGDRVVSGATATPATAAPSEAPPSSTSTELPPPASSTLRRVAPWAAVTAIVASAALYAAWSVKSGEHPLPEATMVAAPRPQPTLAPAAGLVDPAPAPVIPTQPAPVQPSTNVITPDPVAPAPVEEAPNRRPIHRTARPSEVATPGPAADAAAEAEVGFLSLDTSPWAEVIVDGRELGTTPLIRVELPAGDHVIRLRNPDEGIDTEYRVAIRPGQTTARRLGLGDR